MKYSLAGKKIAVTGGCGFIGSHLVSRLKKEKACVYVVDTALKRQASGALPIDVTDYTAFYSFLTQEKIEVIVHLAAVSEVGDAYIDPMRSYMTNVMGTVHILEAARRSGVQGVVVASSDKAYGKTGRRKYRESDPLSGNHPYEASKASADLISQSYCKTYCVPTVITRFGNVYGEGDTHFSRLIPGIMKAYVTGETFQIRSDGTFIRDYLYVGDVVDGYLALIHNLDAVAGEAFNFGSSDTLSVLQVIQKTESILDKKLHCRIQNISINEIPYQSLNWEKVKRKLGWSPKYTLEDSIPAVYEWYKRYLENNM